MLRTKLRNKFLKNLTEANRHSYTKQRNWRVSLLRTEKKKCFANLNKKNIATKKRFANYGHSLLIPCSSSDAHALIQR